MAPVIQGPACPGGGIGRRAGFRCRWAKALGSSSLLLGTILRPRRPRRRHSASETPLSTHLHRGDLPTGIDWGASVAVDTETMGLQTARDRLCLVQLSAGDGVSHLVQI